LEIGGKVKNGLYIVCTTYLCAGFIYKNGRVIKSAPILKKKIKYWVTIAKWVSK